MDIRSRRAFLRHGLCGCALAVGANQAWGKVLTTDLQPLVTHDYQPVDQDERGMWQSLERFEESLAASNRLIQDPALKRYLSDIVMALTDGLTSKLRVYPMREASFNASMCPNGIMIVNSGFLARVRNEAQLAAVLGHECGHYLRQHSIRNWRSIRSKTAIGAFIAVGANVATGATGSNWYDLANAINHNLLLSIFSYGRDLESEADAYGLRLMTQRGYAPEAAGQVWSQLIEERKASARERKQKYKESHSGFDTHPPMSDRMRDLNQTAMQIRGRARSDQTFDDRREAYLKVIGPHRPQLLEEQIKLNDPGASLYLINSLAQDGWDGSLRYFEGEAYRMRDQPNDQERASAAYAQAVALEDAPPQAYRAHGYARLKAGEHEEGKRALKKYLELAANASDRNMIEFTLNQ